MTDCSEGLREEVDNLCRCLSESARQGRFEDHRPTIKSQSVQVNYDTKRKWRRRIAMNCIFNNARKNYLIDGVLFN